MANRQGKFQTPRTPVPPRRNDAGQRRRRRRGPNPLFIILVAVFCVALIAVAAILIHMGKARSDFRKLSEMVEENATATAAPVETTPPETRSTGPTTETTVPTEPEPTEPVMLAKYAPLYEQNHDLFGWLRIDGTVIDYPVMHTPTDPEKYLHTNFKREYSFGGIPFIDANCSADSGWPRSPRWATEMPSAVKTRMVLPPRSVPPRSSWNEAISRTVKGLSRWGSSVTRSTALWSKWP